MRTVRDESGEEHLLVERSAESSLVRDPATGECRYVDNDRLSAVEGRPALAAAVEGVPSALRRTVIAVRDDRSLGLLVEVVDRGPVSVRTLLEDYDLCESDLHGLLAEFRAAGLIREADAPEGRGYRPTEAGAAAVATLRGGDDPE